MTPAPAEVPGAKPSSRSPWSWVPTLYLAEGLPYVVVMTVSVIMYKGLGISNTDIALYTSWLYLPWVIKPLWSPVVDILKTRRQWIWVMQLIIGAGLAGVALTIPATSFFQYTLVFLWLLAFSSATHDIAADGFYMLGTTEKEQTFFVGIRSTFYRIAMISGQGLLVILAGIIQSRTGLPQVDLTVSARSGAALVQAVSPEQFSPPAQQQGPLRLVATPARIEISSEPRPKEEIAAIIAAAKKWNIEHGFNPVLETKKEAEKAPSFWKRNVSGPFGEFLRRHFGRTARATGDKAGNIGVFYLTLTGPPEKERVATLGLASGDKSIQIAEGSRLVFNSRNWNTPAVVVAQLDLKLLTESSAVFKVRSGDIRLSWVVVFFVLTGLFLMFAIYHWFLLPRSARDRPGEAGTAIVFIREFLKTFGSFFRKEQIGIVLLFLLFYRFAEAQLVKLVNPFLLDTREAGGLGLTTGEVGFVYGTVGVIALTFGGLLGGMLASRQGLKFWLWPMVFVMHLPDAMFIYLAYAQPTNFLVINLCVAIEQFGYGFGFTAYMLFMLYVARGQHETAHYAICTGFMALGMMLPGMFSGWLQEIIGYLHFFVWVMLATLPGFAVAAFVRIDSEFGRKS